MDIGILKNKVLFQAKFSVDEFRRLSRGGTILMDALSALEQTIADLLINCCFSIGIVVSVLARMVLIHS
jgi:S-methylmethionine-dependent homocysteine/selenocysteine methylase